MYVCMYMHTYVRIYVYYVCFMYDVFVSTRYEMVRNCTACVHNFSHPVKYYQFHVHKQLRTHVSTYVHLRTYVHAYIIYYVSCMMYMSVHVMRW